MQYLALSLLYLLCLLGVSRGSDKIDWQCLASHCQRETEECASDGECLKAVTCDIGCFDAWEADQTPEKYLVQNCSNVCAFSHDTDAFGTFMTCTSDHKCLDLPSIPSHCRAPANLTLLREGLDISSVLPGWWWAVRGYHRIYDCYDCPHMFFQQLNDTTWESIPLYQVVLQDGTTKLVNARFQWNVLGPTSGPELSFVFYYMGFAHYETWWLLDAAEDLSYLLVYYCGHSLQWHFEGATVLARERSLPDADYDQIAQSFAEGVGLDFSDFCATRTTDCTD